jgi:serine/threonine protein kinase
MWAVGCIMAELFLNRKLFDGASPVAQLEQIVSLLGNPTLSDECSALQVIKRMKPCTRSFERVFQGKNPLAVDLLSKLLQFDPEKRITAVEALQHPFLQDVFEDSVQAAEKFDFSFETQVTDLIAIKREAFTTIVNFNSITFSNTTVAELRLDCFKERVLTPNAEVAQKELREIMHDVGEGSEKSPSKVKRGMLHWLGLWF